MKENTLFAFLYLGCSLLGKASYKATRCLTIGRNLYYLLKPNMSVSDYYKQNNKWRNGENK